MYTNSKHGLSTIFQPGRVAESDSRSTEDQEDRVRSSGPAHLPWKEKFFLPLIQEG